MIEINWKAFELKHPKSTEAFETLCYFIFCRKYNLTEGILTDFNQVGLETEPIKNSEGKNCGFQAKYFGKNVNYTNIGESIDKALKNYKELNHIIIYVNQQAQTSCESAKSIEAKCAKKGVTVEWFLPANFLVSLNQPNNLDLAEFYFGKTDIFKMLSDSKSIRMNNLLQSREYIELNLWNNDYSLTISEYCHEILKSERKLHIFSGAAGTGKSVCMRKLFNIYGGFDTQSKENQLEVIGKVGALCIFVNLNNTSLYSLESIISSYKSTYFANSSNNNFIYLFDGLDEIPSSSITTTLLFIESILEKDTTKKIVISSRLSSYNKFILKATFPGVPECTIENLKEYQIQTYFDNKGNVEKTAKLNRLCNINGEFFKNITDVLTLALLWEHILRITDANFFPSLMEFSVSTILNDVHYKKYLDALNLPNPKDKAIIEINKDLAFYLFENEKFNFTQKELYEIINDKFPKCDYISINQIVSYMADSFFDIVVTDNVYTFSYRHRRFLEYFILLRIDNKIQEDLNYLRKRNIIINQDLFEHMLIPYLQNKAIKNKDIPLAFKVGLFNVYLGNDKAWGVDKSFYYWSSWIIYSIAALPNGILQNVIEDKTLPIHRFFYEVPDRILSLFSSDEKLRVNDDFRQYYINYTLLIVLIHKLDKKEFLAELLFKYEKIAEFSREKKYYFKSISNRDNYLVWRNILYINTVIFNNRVDNIIETTIEKLNNINVDDLFGEYISTDILYLSSLYYNLLIYYPEKCTSIIKKMNLNQVSVFTLAITKPECLSTIIKSNELTNALIGSFDIEINIYGFSSVICLALKKILGCSLTENEISIVTNYLNSNPFKRNSIFWKEHYDTVGFILMAFSEHISLIGMDSAVSQYANVYNAYFKLLTGTFTISKFVSYIKKYLYSNSEAIYYIKILLGKALALCDTDENSLKGALDYLDDAIKDYGSLIIYHIMKLHNPKRFDKTISNSLINKLNSPSVFQDIDYTSTSDSLFMLSYITSSHDGLSSYDLLLKGLSNGMMRMNERKDTIGDYKLFESLEVILKNNWLSTEQLIAYLDRVLLIADKMNAFHIENDVHGKTMELLQNYDFKATEYYYNQVSSLEEVYNDIHFNFAMSLVCRGRNVDVIEKCLHNIKASFDRYDQKIEWNSFYYKISVYLHIAICDFYSADCQNGYFEKACEEINKLENSGWDRELEAREYEIYIKLCNLRHKEVNVSKAKEWECSKNSKEQENNTLKTVSEISSVEDLKTFISGLHRDYLIDSFEINEMFIQKSIDLVGNIDDILKMLSEFHYPSNVSYSTNSRNFWMTVVSALKNVKAKSSMIDYLLTHGGGHDGFSELIKIYGHLNSKDICLKSFDAMMQCIEFLLC